MVQKQDLSEQFLLMCLQILPGAESEEAVDGSAHDLSWDYVTSPPQLDRNLHQMSAVERAQRTKSFPLSSGQCIT